MCRTTNLQSCGQYLQFDEGKNQPSFASYCSKVACLFKKLIFKDNNFCELASCDANTKEIAICIYMYISFASKRWSFTVQVLKGTLVDLIIAHHRPTAFHHRWKQRKVRFTKNRTCAVVHFALLAFTRKRFWLMFQVGVFPNSKPTPMKWNNP